MAANSNGTGDDTMTTDASDDIVHRLQDLTVSSTSDASPVGAMSNQPTPPSLPPVPTPANNAVVDVTSVQNRAVTSSCSKGTMAAKLDRLRRRRQFQERLPPPSVASITDALQNLMPGAEAGFRFRPTALELVGCFLRPMIAGWPLPRTARFIHNADVYATAPDLLAATHMPAPAGIAGAGKPVWYFFSPLHYQTSYRKTTPCRRVGSGGTWKVGGNRVRLAEEGEADNWYVMHLIYYEFRHGGSSGPKKMTSNPTEWRMREYGIGQGGRGQLLHPLVLCEVFRSPSGR